MRNGASTGVVEAFKIVAADCPLTPAIELIGEKWTILILRGSMSGLRHFEEFQGSLGIARNILSDRLAKLVAGGVLQRSPDSADRRKVVYTLTDMGRDLLPALVALRQWSETWITGTPEYILTDDGTGQPLRKIVAQAADGRIIQPEDLLWVQSRADGRSPARGRAATRPITTLAGDYS